MFTCPEVTHNDKQEAVVEEAAATKSRLIEYQSLYWYWPLSGHEEDRFYGFEKLEKLLSVKHTVLELTRRGDLQSETKSIY